MRAFTAATGVEEWAIQLPGQIHFDSPPTAWGGVVYTVGSGGGATLCAVDGATGSVLWTQGVGDFSAASPAVTDTGVYVTAWCPTAEAFDPTSGAPKWEYQEGCLGLYGSTPVVTDSGLWVRDDGGDVVLNLETGVDWRNFSADRIPVFDGTMAYFVRDDGGLEAFDLTSGAGLWRFYGDGHLSTAPVAANGFVYIVDDGHGVGPQGLDR